MYLTQWFEPEPNIVKGLAFVRRLEAAGHQVTVVTGLPNYPTGKIYPGYRFGFIQHETIDGVSIVRLPLYPSHDNSSLRRSCNYLSFFVSSFIYCLFGAGRYDIVYAYHPPITVGLAAAIAGRLRRLPFVLDVQDLWPDTVATVGMKGASRIAGLLDSLCTFVYRRAAAIIVQSEGMQATLAMRGVPEQKLTTIYNWADVAMPAPGRRSAKAGFTIVYGGNLGRAQSLATIVDASAILQQKRDDIRILLYGEGVEESSLRERAARTHARNVEFRPRVSQAEIIRIFADADALLLHLRDDPLFAITIPSKTQFYLAMGRPIVAGIAGEGADLLRRSGAAIVVPPGDAAAMADAIADVADLPADRREAMGACGLQFSRDTLSFEQAMVRTIALLEGTNSDRRRD